MFNAQRGRKTEGQFNVVRLQPATIAIQPPDEATATERRLFAKVVRQMPPGHFVQSDDELILSYVQSILAVRKYAARCRIDERAMKPFTLAQRAQTNMARSLRLTPLGRSSPQTLARKAANHHVPVYQQLADYDET